MRVPLATYRLQLGPHCTFDDAAALAPYLRDLGVSDAYTSPFFETSSSASHGYDVNDHDRLRQELGGEAGFARFAAALRAQGMGLLIDVVPNHVGIAQNRNRRWQDVLEHGPASPEATFFDIDWTPVKTELHHKVLLPILGDQYGAVLDAGQLQLEREGSTFRVRYYDTLLPLGPRTYARVLGQRLSELQARLGPEHPDVVALKSIVTRFATLPPRTETDPERVAARQREVAIARERLAELLATSPEIAAFVDDNVRALNGTPGDPRSFDALDALLAEQAYRVAFWRVAGEEINYRRFFDINELAAIRMELPEVFAATHRLIFRLIGERAVTGLRVDHPDGLYDPAEYFRRLQRGCARALGSEPGRDDFYVVAEKILAPGEYLPETWATAGTTGYEFLNLVNGIFVDRSQARAMEHLYARLIRLRPPFGEVVHECKRLVLETSMAAELHTLAHRLNVLSEKHRASRDFTLGSLTTALREIITAFPVYRTYVGETTGGLEPPEAGAAATGPTPTSLKITDRDRDYIARAIAQARRRTPTMSASVYDWIQDVLTLRVPPGAAEADRQERLDFVRRFQQITPPVTAKGYEDTTLYRFNRLVSLNEVGGDPARFGVSLAEFHAEMAARQRRSPHALSATSTHDTKRSEDVRARIDVLSEIPAEWRARVTAWQRLNRKHRTTVDGQPTPGANTEYFFYQTLVGAWPISVERLRAYMLKAVREAKVHTSWVNPNVRYDEAIARFVEAVLDPARSARFLEDFTAFQARVAHVAAFTSLAQTLIKITAPGVPDFYQGCELWDLSLVDPDNRRPVDWDLRRRLLGELTAMVGAGGDRAALAHELVKTKEDGRIKLYLIREGLAARRERRALFDRGEYWPVDTRGAWAEHLCAFARVGAPDAAITVVPRLLARRGLDGLPLGAGYWADTEVVLPADLAGAWRNRLTGERLVAEPVDDAAILAAGAVLAAFPVALLLREAA
ncbi:MAG TPA: malto-oligosyltrehalose synthase [Candidatus Tectomicrobia bacterium]|nr:malto-oligosyltrehalose synthase [Candidatus Tectomicrobia bacterium]